MSLFTGSPGKSLWIIGAAVATIIKVPFMVLYFTPKSTRPVSKWTLYQAFMNKLMNAFLYHSAFIESKTLLNLDPGSLGERFAIAKPGPLTLYQELASLDESIQPVPVGGTWYPRPSTKSEASLVTLHFHGGGYAIATGRPEDSAFCGQQLSRISSHSFLVQYRLATNAKGQFPAALQDAITTYYYLLHDLDVPAHNIIISGDSAGGHIVTCLLRFLAQNGESAGLPNPRAALLWSSAIDLLSATDVRSIKANANYGIDYTDARFMSWGATRFVTRAPAAQPYLNPLGQAFATKIPIWGHVGEKEFFHREMLQFVQEMSEIRGNKAQLTVEKNAPHDIFFTGDIMGWQKEAEQAADNAGAWVRTLSAQS